MLSATSPANPSRIDKKKKTAMNCSRVSKRHALAGGSWSSGNISADTPIPYKLFFLRSASYLELPSYLIRRTHVAGIDVPVITDRWVAYCMLCMMQDLSSFGTPAARDRGQSRRPLPGRNRRICKGQGDLWVPIVTLVQMPTQMHPT